MKRIITMAAIFCATTLFSVQSFAEKSETLGVQLNYIGFTHGTMQYNPQKGYELKSQYSKNMLFCTARANLNCQGKTVSELSNGCHVSTNNCGKAAFHMLPKPHAVEFDGYQKGTSLMDGLEKRKVRVHLE